MDSQEKLQQLMRGAYDVAPSDEGTARMVQMLQVSGPMIGQFLPDTAAELDETLLGVAAMCLRLRSDGAATPFSIEELLAGEGVGA